jgi:protein-disulfide isomerase
MYNETQPEESGVVAVGGVAERVTEKKDRFLPISILVAAVLIGGSIIFSVFYRPVATGTVPSPTPSVQGSGVAAQQPPAVSGAAVMPLGPRDEILGNANAPVTIVEYGDYQCPFCTAFFKQTEAQIVSNYVNTGKVKMVFRNFPFLGAESTAAAGAAECAVDQKKLWVYHDALYQSKADDEAKGGGENDGSLNRTLFLKLAQQVKLDVAAFTACLDANKYADQVTQDKTTATAAGVNSTPSFFINGTQILGAQPYAQFQAAIEAALKA